MPASCSSTAVSGRTPRATDSSPLCCVGISCQTLGSRGACRGSMPMWGAGRLNTRGWRPPGLTATPGPWYPISPERGLASRRVMHLASPCLLAGWVFSCPGARLCLAFGGFRRQVACWLSAAKGWRSQQGPSAGLRLWVGQCPHLKQLLPTGIPHSPHMLWKPGVRRAFAGNPVVGLGPGNGVDCPRKPRQLRRRLPFVARGIPGLSAVWPVLVIVAAARSTAFLVLYWSWQLAFGGLMNAAVVAAAVARLKASRSARPDPGIAEFGVSRRGRRRNDSRSGGREGLFASVLGGAAADDHMPSRAASAPNGPLALGGPIALVPCRLRVLSRNA